jgi:amidophosphoribosyltransferase
MPSAAELIAHGRTVEEVRDAIGADWLIFQDLEDLEETCREGNRELTGFDCSVFNGNYVTGDIDEAYLTDLDNRRNDNARVKQENLFTELANEPMAMIGLHNDD